MNTLLDLVYSGSLNTVINVLAVVSLLIGALECFAGYKIMKVMIAIYGFLVGACIGAAVGLYADELWIAAAAGIVLGIVIAIIAYKMYLIGVFLYAGLNSAAVFMMIFRNMQTVPCVVFAVIIGIIVGIAAVCFVRPVMIVSTSVTGAAAILSATCLIMRITPFDHILTSIALLLGFSCAGIICQYKTSTRNSSKMISLVRKKQNKKHNEMTFSERKYPGMQRAYRNFCIKCGCDLMGAKGKCPNCGFKY